MATTGLPSVPWNMNLGQSGNSGTVIFWRRAKIFTQSWGWWTWGTLTWLTCPCIEDVFLGKAFIMTKGASPFLDRQKSPKKKKILPRKSTNTNTRSQHPATHNYALSNSTLSTALECLKHLRSRITTHRAQRHHPRPPRPPTKISRSIKI